MTESGGLAVASVFFLERKLVLVHGFISPADYIFSGLAGGAFCHAAGCGIAAAVLLGCVKVGLHEDICKLGEKLIALFVVVSEDNDNELITADAVDR